MKRDVPEPWASRMIRVGLVDPRNGRPSMSKLAERANTHPSTISAMMYGSRETSREVVDRVADALFPDSATRSRRRREVFEWVGRALEVTAPFTPHPDADLLNEKERQAVNELIRLLAASKKRSGKVEERTRGDVGLSSLPPPNDPDAAVAWLLADDQDLELARRYIRQAKGNLDEAARLLAHDGAKGARVDEKTWIGALKLLAPPGDRSSGPADYELPEDLAARRNKKRPPRGPREQGAD